MRTKFSFVYLLTVTCLIASSYIFACDESCTIEQLRSENARIVTQLRLIEQRLSAAELSANKANQRLDKTTLAAVDHKTGNPFACGQQDVANGDLIVMYGSRDGTSCNVTNLNYYKRLELRIPQ